MLFFARYNFNSAYHIAVTTENKYKSTLCLKKVPTFKLSVTLSYLKLIFKILHCCKAYEISYKTYTAANLNN